MNIEEMNIVDLTTEEKRKSKNPHVRCTAALDDRCEGRDLSWARKDPVAVVRWVAAWADRDANRDMIWALNDSSVIVRQIAEEVES